MRTECRPKAGAWIGYALALGATIIWSGNFIVARGLHDAILPGTLAFLRWFTATLILLPIAAEAVWRERRTIGDNLGYILLTAFLGVTVFNTLIYLAARSTNALNLSLIATSSPVFTLVFARIVLGEPFSAGRVGGVALAVLGIVLLLTRGDFSMLAGLRFSVGDLWMVLAAMIFGGYTVLIRRKPEHLGQAAFLLSIFGLGLLLLLPWAAAEVISQGMPDFSFSLLGSVLYIGLGASLVSYALWNKAVSAIGPARCGFIYYSLPVFSGIEAYFLLGEPVGLVHVASGALILTGIVWASRS
ncbi:MAG: DMT family transporter [Acidobacteriota bacterium]